MQRASIQKIPCLNILSRNVEKLLLLPKQRSREAAIEVDRENPDIEILGTDVLPVNTINHQDLDIMAQAMEGNCLDIVTRKTRKNIVEDIAHNLDSSFVTLEQLLDVRASSEKKSENKGFVATRSFRVLDVL